MTALKLYRLSGVALIIGSLLIAVSSTASGIMFPDASSVTAAADPLNVLQGTVGVVGAILLLLGLPGMYASAARTGGLTWLVGIILIAIMTMLFGIFLGLTGVLVSPVLATQAPDLLRAGPPQSFLALFVIGTLANVIGAVLMAIPILAKRLYARWCGLALLTSAVLAILSFFANGPSAFTSIVSQILNIASSLPMLVALGWVGYELWSRHTRVTGFEAGAAVPQPA